MSTQGYIAPGGLGGGRQPLRAISGVPTSPLPSRSIVVRITPAENLLLADLKNPLAKTHRVR